MKMPKNNQKINLIYVKGFYLYEIIFGQAIKNKR